VDVDGAGRALAYASAAGVPVLILSPPAAPAPPDGYGFVIGIDAAASRGALEAALTAAAPGSIPVVVGPRGLACDVEGGAGRPRFPRATGGGPRRRCC
jgi:hypothetical protein